MTRQRAHTGVPASAPGLLLEVAAMGTPCTLCLQGEAPAVLQAVAQTLQTELQRLEAKYSRYRPDSLMGQINRVAAAGGQISLDEETRALLNYAQTCFEQSGGLFDITSGALSALWHRERTQLPTALDIAQVLAGVGWQRLAWDGQTLAFPAPGMALDLGGIVKEYAADRLVALARSAGVMSGYVNLGGDLAVIGPQSDGLPWQVALRGPWGAAPPLAVVAISHGALASSGDYARCLVLQGRRWGHIVNPLTGWPTQGVSAVSVWAPLCVMAGSASTVAMLQGARAPQWLAELPWPSWWADDDGKVGSSTGCGGTPSGCVTMSHMGGAQRP